jgi:hypothetical protein
MRVSAEVGHLAMSIFSKFFRSSDERRVEQIVDQARKDATRQLAPLSNLGLAVLKASASCRDGVGSFIVSKTEEKRAEAQMFAFFEFMYFFMHLTVRAATNVMTEAEIKVLQRHLGQFMASVAVRSYFDHWPEDLKTRMTRDFYADLNAAEIDYAKCSAFDSPSPAEDRSAEIATRLLSRVDARVASVIGSEPLSSSKIAKLAFDEWANMNLVNLLEDFKRDSMTLPDVPHAPRP